jgi:hypothetical protein
MGRGMAENILAETGENQAQVKSLILLYAIP